MPERRDEDSALLATPPNSDIAVVGMACRFPGAADPDQFWQNIRNGVESIVELSREELEAAGVEASRLRDPRYVRRAAVLDDVEQFDAGFFGLSPRDAAIMDPQHRHFLEVAWEALEYAGHPPEAFDGSVGVYAGCGMTAYMMYHLVPNRQLMDTVGLFLVRHTGNDKDFLATRVSYSFDLRGPSVNIQTACSTSLVAIHAACQNLIAGECDMAVAGGVTIELPQRVGYLYQEGEILSHDGHCRAFDASSTGTVFGSGAGAVVLRRLPDALADGDTVLAVIRGTAINNDGAGKVGYLAPSVDGQAHVIAEAQAVADVPPATISYVEAHGTGTQVGDPIEVAALTEAFRRGTDRVGFCGLGSVKSNIGHLDTAAGVASFIKVVQALRHRELPPSLHFRQPNALIDFGASPFYVNAQLTPWSSPSGAPRRAGVSSLGVGGTNAHCVLEEAPALAPTPSPPCPWQIIPISARTRTALDRSAERLATYLAGDRVAPFHDIAYTLQCGRRGFAHRRVAVATDAPSAAEALRAGHAGRVATGVAPTRPPAVAFLFPGGGAQYAGMGAGLYEALPEYRRALDECLEVFQPLVSCDLRPLMFPAQGTASRAAREIERPSLALPTLFATSYALARLWMAWGVVPSVMAGHSMGEYVAACLAGVLSLEGAASLVSARGRLFEQVPRGGMLSIPLPESAVVEQLPPGVSIAAVNGPQLCVASGPTTLLEVLEQRLGDRNVETARLHIDVAAHSSMLEPILGEFREAARKVAFRAPQIPFVSNVTGGWADAAMVGEPEYWVTHLRQTVRFDRNLDALLSTENLVLIEVGPGTTLTTLAKAHPARTAGHDAIASLRHPRDPASDVQVFSMACGRAWVAGTPIDWSKIHSQPRRRVPLPTYAFDHQRYWIDRPEAKATQPAPSPRALARISDTEEWLSVQTWQRADCPEAPLPAPAEAGSWLVFLDDIGIAQRLVDRLRHENHSVVTVRMGRAYRQRSVDEYVVSPGRREDFDAMFQAMAADGKLPRRILHAWSLSADESRSVSLDALDTSLDRSFYSLLFLAQALGAHDVSAGAKLVVVTNGVQQVIDEPVVHPEQATALGPSRVIARELPSVATVTVDVRLPRQRRVGGRARWRREVDALTSGLLDELCAASPESVVAYRRRRRWTQVMERLRLSGEQSRRMATRPEGVYLITGGLGAIGLSLAQHLATTVKARVVLVGRTALPDRTSWNAFLDEHDATDPIVRRIRQIQQIEDAGGRVLVVAADVTDVEHMRAAVRTTVETFGPINGVIHAAGTIADGVMPFKTKDSATAVLAPKVRGTVVLDEVVAGQPLDFFALCSSTSAVLGPVGQVDYTAANAFLNAFAFNRQGRAPGYTIAIGWGLWKDVGMAVESARLLGYRRVSDHPVPLAHPLLQNCRVTSAGDTVCQPVYSVAAQWVLDEHRLSSGVALVPGTGYLEIARALASHLLPSAAVEIGDVAFVTPLAVGNTEQRHVRIWATKTEGGGFNVAVRSYTRRDEAGAPAWVTHATWQVGPASPPSSPSVSIDEIRARCPKEVVHPDDGTPQTRQAAYLRLGPRWGTLRRSWYGSGEALALLSLDSSFVTDLDVFAFHPSLVDLATGFAFPLLDEYEQRDDFFVPLSYGQVSIYQPLPPRFYSHARCANPREREVAVFDFTLVDERGAVLATIHEFVMRRIDPDALVDPRAAMVGDRLVPPTLAEDAGTTSDAAPLPELLELGLAHGISPTEGARIFSRLLSHGRDQQILVSSLDLDDLERLVDASVQRPDSEAVDSARQARPASASDYLAPRTDLERQVAAVWQEVLGLDRVGVRDNFFDLGGHSLLAVRLFNKLKKLAGQHLPLSTLFEAPTVEQLAVLLQRDAPAASWSCLVPIQPNGTRPPFFCIHGLGGNIVEFLHLARHLRAGQPFYGIQARGLDGKEPYFTRVEDFASHYIKQIRAVQPQGPYYLGGASFGGLVAYEMARQLQQQGDRVAFLALFDSYGQDYPRPLGTRTVLQRRLNGLKVRFDLHVGNLRALPSGERWEYVSEKLGQLPGRYHRRFMKLVDRAEERVRLLLLPRMLRQQFALTGERAKDVGRINIPRVIRDVQVGVLQAAQAYRLSSYDGEVTLFRATSQPPGIHPDRTNGWGGLVRGALRILDVPGYHGAIIREPRVKVLADALNRCLDEAQAQHAPRNPATGAPASTRATGTDTASPLHVGAR